MNRRVELWKDKEITTTLTVPGTIIRPAVGREMEQNTLKTTMKKLVNKCDCFKNCEMLNRKPMQFLKHSSYTGVSTGV